MNRAVQVGMLLAIGAAIPVFAEEPAKIDINGTWVIIEVEQGGEPDSSGRDSTMHFGEGKFQFANPKGLNMGGGSFKIDASAAPAKIDLMSDLENKKLPNLVGVFQFDGDNLVLCLSNKERPTEFKTSQAEPAIVKFTLKRKPKTE